MPRNYKKKLGIHGNKNYDEVYLQRAVTAVKQKQMSMRAASQQYGVPYTTLNNHVHGTVTLKYGRPQALDENSERQLVEALQVCAEWGFPLKPIDIRYIVQQSLNKRGLIEKRFRDNLPGTDWFLGFMKRNRDVTVKLAENTKRVRAALSHETIKEYFDNLEETIKNIPPSNIINYDETNFVDDPGAAKVVLKKGSKHAFRAIDSSKTNTTVMFAIAANGTLLPPYVVYKAKHSYQGWTEGGLEGSKYNHTPSGWFDANIFEDWFYGIILPYFRHLDGDKVLIGDNLNSHITLSVIRECENNNIKFVLLPPNSTHLLQPLDVAYFRPLKASWRKNLEKWKIKNRGVLPKTLFPKLLKDTIEDIGLRSQANSIAGFKACGIIPFNPNAVLNKLPRKNPQNTESEKVWTEVIVDHLSELKSGPSQAPRRGKKINVVAGRNISSSDLNISEETKENPKKNNKILRKNKRKRQVSSSSSDEIDEIDLVDDESNYEISEKSKTPSPLPSFQNVEDTFGLRNMGDYEIGESSINQQQPNQTTETTANSAVEQEKDLLVNDFVITKFKTNKRDRFYIGKVEELLESSITISTLRKQNKKDCCFVFPQNPDWAEVTKDQIVQKIKLKNVRRGRHFFTLPEGFDLE